MVFQEIGSCNIVPILWRVKVLSQLEIGITTMVTNLEPSHLR